MNDKTYTVTLRKIDWTHVLVTITDQTHNSKLSPLVRQRYGEIGRAIRDQIEQSTKEENK